MYSFLTTDLSKINNVLELEATFLLIAKTRNSIDSLKWYAIFEVVFIKYRTFMWVLCALEKECMAPINSKINCNFGRDRYSADPVCHRSVELISKFKEKIIFIINYSDMINQL